METHVLEKDPTTYTMLTYAGVLAISAWGGVAHYLRKIRLGLAARFSLAELIGEIVISGFVGMITFYLCEAQGIKPLHTAALVGISGHMGSRLIFIMEEQIKSTWKRWIGK